MKTLIVAALLLVSAGAASADSVWQYQGNSTPGANNLIDNALNPCNCALSGSVTFDSSWNVLSYDFTDGTHTLTQANSTGYFDPFYEMTSTTPFAEWFVSLRGTGISMLTEYYGSGYEATDDVYNGSTFLYVEGNRGSWTDPVSTPEPSSLLLLGAGLAALALKRRHKPADTTVWESLG